MTDTDFDLDLEDIFDEIEHHVVSVVEEDVWAKLDRVRNEHELNAARTGAIPVICDLLQRDVTRWTEENYSDRLPDKFSLARTLTGIYQYYDWDLQRTLNQFPPADELTLDHKVWADFVPDAYKHIVIRRFNQVRRLEHERTASAAELKSVTTHFTEEKLIQIGAQVRFVTNDCWDEGIVTDITAASIKVKLTQDGSHSGRTSARLPFNKAWNMSYYGGRRLEVLRSPMGVYTLAAHEAKVAAVRERISEVRDGARRQAQNAQSALYAAHRAQRDYEEVVVNAQAKAHREAMAMLIDVYRSEFESLLQGFQDEELSKVPAYERPEILDNEPSTNYLDYLPEDIDV